MCCCELGTRDAGRLSSTRGWRGRGSGLNGGGWVWAAGVLRGVAVGYDSAGVGSRCALWLDDLVEGGGLHYAGSLGQPRFKLISGVPDWRSRTTRCFIARSNVSFRLGLFLFNLSSLTYALTCSHRCTHRPLLSLYLYLSASLILVSIYLLFP